MITLRNVDMTNIWDITALSVYDHQSDFVASNTDSILEAYATTASGSVALPFGIYNDDTLIGFIMFGYGTIEGDDCEPDIADGNYCLWRLMIDKSYQGKGLGKQALNAALDYIRSYPCGPAKYCWLSYEPENIRAKTLYNSFGFEENGEHCETEVVAVLKL